MEEAKNLFEKLPDARHASPEDAELTKSSMSSPRDEHNNADGASRIGSNNRQLGSAREEQACKYLQKLGYTIKERNWHWGKRGEIDIIAIDPQRYSKEYLIFIEVKYRSWSMDMSLHALDYKKIEQLKKLATIYMERRGYHAHKTPVSFDFIAISGRELRHIKDIVR